MKLEAAADPAGIRQEIVSFEELPSQSRLFLEFLDSASGIPSEFWPNRDVPLEDYSETALRHYESDREVLCDALRVENESYGATELTLENIELLRDKGAVSVITGQQAGLFSGPAYTFYKALSVIRIAERLRGKGINAIPVFWIATEDHDFEEISAVNFRGREGGLQTVSISIDESDIGRPIGKLVLGREIPDVIRDFARRAGKTRFSAETAALLEGSYAKGTLLGDAFGKLLTALLGKYGLVFVNPLNPAIRRLSTPVIVDAITKSAELRAAVSERNQRLLGQDFHLQVNVEDGFVPLFVITEDGKRRALIEDPVTGRFRSKDRSVEYQKAELVDLATSRPEMFSPNALLRPVAQDFVFPSVCYVGGAAEISYFAQNGAIYEALGRPVTPVRHRNGFTLLEARHNRTMQRYGVGSIEIFAGFEATLRRIANREADRETVSFFEAMKTRFGTELDVLGSRLTENDPGLSDSAEKRKAKILWHIDVLRRKFLKAEALRDKDRMRRLDDLFGTGLPGGKLQERTLSFLDFVYHHGQGATDLVYDAVRENGNAHTFLYL